MVDSPGTYRDDKQNNSYPAYSKAFYGGTAGDESTDMPLDRDLPPGSEQPHADYAATRIIAKSVNPKRDASFKFIGINTSWRAGDRISYIAMNLQPLPGGAGTTTWTYNLASACTSVMHDYISQITTVGGISSEYVSGAL
jgi:hypothetical protein